MKAKITEAKRGERIRIAEHIRSLPTDGFDKWYFHNREIADEIDALKDGE